MSIDGMDQLDNMVDIGIWQNVTSRFVLGYWNDRARGDVRSVETEIVRQTVIQVWGPPPLRKRRRRGREVGRPPSSPPPRRTYQTDPEAGTTTAPRNTVRYSQDFYFLSPYVNVSLLATEPFASEDSRVVYREALREIGREAFLLISGSSAAVVHSSEPPPPTMSPSKTGPTSPPVGGGSIAAIVLGVVLAAVLGAGGWALWGRRREKGNGEEEEEEEEDRPSSRYGARPP